MSIHPKSLYKTSSTFRRYYKKDEDLKLLKEIKAIVEQRKTYGYKRVTAMLNKKHKEIEERINKKRVYRIMKLNGLILPKTEKVRTHIPTGKVMTLYSNTRWCSDCFEIRCYNAEKVYVSFVIDSCDREIISFVAKKTPLLQDDIQSLLLMSVEKRFNDLKASRQIEFLSDRGSIYRAYNVQNLARELNLKSCFTAAYSPESNGMSESLVKTLKRDYVYVNDCETADKVLEMLEGWIKDYNENAPHSALGFKSPLEYRLAVNRG